MELVEQLHSAAEHLTRQLPEAHTVTRRYRTLKFHGASERFLELLYRIDVQTLTDQELEETERVTRVALKIVEIHMLLRYTPTDTADCVYCTDLIHRLRGALEALESGLPTDPAKRPSDEELLSELALNLDRAGIH
jgi:hypothetical protein